MRCERLVVPDSEFGDPDRNRGVVIPQQDGGQGYDRPIRRDLWLRF
jgi:hypothetical protein